MSAVMAAVNAAQEASKRACESQEVKDIANKLAPPIAGGLASMAGGPAVGMAVQGATIVASAKAPDAVARVATEAGFHVFGFVASLALMPVVAVALPVLAVDYLINGERK